VPPFASQKQNRKSLSRRRLFIESLETRNLLASDFGFANTFGGGAADSVRSVGIDAAGNVYITGQFYDTIDFDPASDASVELGHLGQLQSFFAKYAASGELVWAKQLGTTVLNTASDLAVDQEGNMWVIGRFHSATDFDPGPGEAILTPTDNSDLYVLKLDTNGNYAWAGNFDGSIIYMGIATDGNGNAYLTGHFEGTADLDPGPGVTQVSSNAGSSDIYLTKLSAAGELLWTKTFGGSSSIAYADHAKAISVDANGNVVIAGGYSGEVDFDPGAGVTRLTSHGPRSFFTAKFDTNGNFVWARDFGSGIDHRALATDAQGNVVLTGYLSSGDFDPGPGNFILSAPFGYSSAYVTKLDANGDFQWAKQFSDPSGGYSKGSGIAVHPNGDIFVTGSFSNATDLDPDADSLKVTAVGGTDAYVSRLTANGGVVSAYIFGGSGNESGNDIAVSEAANAAYIGGVFGKSVDFDPTTHTDVRTAVGGDDMFLVKLLTDEPNRRPTQITLTDNTISEDVPSGTVVGHLSTTDPDDDTFVYSLVTGEGSSDNALFTIEGDALLTNASLDFEAKSSYSVRIRSLDAGGLWKDEVFTINAIDANDAPASIELSASSIDENLPSGSVVGILTTTDQDSGDTFTYQLVSGDGDTDNALFGIADGQLVTAASFDFESQSTYSIRLRATDGGGLGTERVVTINVGNINEAPVSLALSNNVITENSPVGNAIGNFSATDPDADDAFTYQLVTGEGDADNGLFVISGDRLLTNASFNFEAKSEYTVRVRATDRAGLSIERAMIVNVTDLNEAPTLDVAKQPVQYSYLEDERFPYGTPIYVLFPGTRDVDQGALRGIAVIGANGVGQGEWQFTLDGFVWKPLGDVSPSSARLLPIQGSQTRIRFVPAPDFNGTVSLQYVAWDQTQGTTRGVFDISQPNSTGGATAFSVTSRTSPLTVLPRNDAPKLDTSRNPTLLPINEDNRNSYGTPVWTLIQGMSDKDANALRGIAITTVTGTDRGTWQYTLDGGASWQSLVVSKTSAKLLPAQGNLARIRFAPEQDFFGTVRIGYFAWDQSSGVAGGTHGNILEPTSRGGSSAFSINFETASLTINPVNDAPRLTLPSAPVGYALNSPAVLLASTATVKDPDTVRFAGGWLKVEITAGADANDRLSIGGPFKVVEENLIWNNQETIGTVQGGAGSEALQISLNADATLYRVEQLVRSIKFGTLGSSKTGLRTVAFSVSDGTSNCDVATLDVQIG
jgi:hypothetical protein